MKGKFDISIWNKRIRYDLTIRRNITIIQGDSATGKTHLIEMIQEYAENGIDSGIQMKADVKCIQAPVFEWEDFIDKHPGYILFFDEDCKYVVTEEFASAVKRSDNYFVIITREALGMLPYSVNEIYGIKCSGKYAGTKQVYNELYQIYGHSNVSEKAEFVEVVVEDSNSGFEFWSKYYSENVCISAGGKSNVFDCVNNKKKQLVIADGAAFGCEMDKVMQLLDEIGSVELYLPESFEYLLLKSEIFRENRIVEKLQETYNFADSKEYFSWERFYTDLLVEETQGKQSQYKKDKLNEYYLSDKNVEKIICIIPDIIKK